MAAAHILPPQALQHEEPFDPSKHLAFSPPSKVYTMADLGLPRDTGVSPVAVSEPFPLFTQEAVMRMRSEVLDERVLANCMFSSNLAPTGQLRGYAAKYAPFVYDAWKDHETLRIISQVAGIDLTVQFDYEIGHINLSSLKDKDDQNDETNDKPIVGWHRDSYPFVCVTMLSDCTGMVGGETALRTGREGEILKVRGPEMGHAVVLQGRYIEHQALRALGTKERITMVTSFRPRSSNVRDDTVLTTVRPVSDLSELYYQFAKYRLEMLEERIRQQLREMTDARAADRTVPTKKMKDFFREQAEFLAHMDQHVVDEDEVVKGALH
ncbi:hypothetical protein B0H66DRAFT_629677 [Apodospora peruviana]|uniref:Fe2OG dioxygenase domain-containing protein n=1 Tax=Apodospora peruviana TaxID=516989 RepID=A0AAE0HVJ3_9PEZI|nr:hypothetical protein B0H66DRAFT_614625 [Apodospora peruviana]KAK3313688.1 hypothetical protein B0H66DRAFT_629677 [Apodospora peruviana]